MEERTMNYIKTSILAIALCSIALSCNDEDTLQDNVQDNIQDGNQEGTQDNSPNDDQGSAAITLNDALTEWGTPYDDVVAHMDGYESNTTSDENTLHFSANRGREVAYRFHNNQLCATLVTFDANLQLDYGSLLSDYIYLGELDGCNIHEDIANNTMASVWKEAERVVVGFAPIKSDAYEQAEPIAAITGDCFNIGISTAELSGSVRGVDSSVEVGFIYGTTMDLSETNGIKVSTISSGDFTISITDLYDETHYYYCSYAIVEDTYYFGDIREFTTVEIDLANTPDLSASGSANCYIVSKIGTYKFSATKGNGTESVGPVSSVKVLWETFGTDTAPEIGDLINEVRFEENYVIFKTNKIYKEGNAVIAATDKWDKILWSWHIWFTDQPGTCTLTKNAGIIMDRNLGAISATHGAVGALGLLYQWGRKDPFIGSSSTSKNIEAQSTITWPAAVASTSQTGTISFATQNPTTFITYDDSYSDNYDWCYSPCTRWLSSKTIYDPCPAGWKVPEGGTSGPWYILDNDDYWSFDNDGVTLYKPYSNPASWFPCSGERGGSNGAIRSVGTFGGCWTSTCRDEHVYGLYISSNFGSIGNFSSFIPSYAQSVRCIQE